MSTGPWKNKKPPSPVRNQRGPLREIAELFEELSALEQKKAQTHGHLSAWFRTIGLASGELPGTHEDDDAALLEQRSA